MDFLPDILDHLGKTPREFGALHAHFESVTTVDGTRVIARVLYQAAFDPLPVGAQVAFHAASDEGAQGEQLGCYDIPSLADRSAVRVAYPLRVPGGATHVVAFIHSPPPTTKAERVRPAWKLHDTIEIPKESDLQRVQSRSLGLDLGVTLLGTALMGGTGLVIAFNLSSSSPAGSTRTTVHQARELPPGLVRVISSEVTAPIDSPREETLWRQGQPLPDAPVVVYARPATLRWSGVRRCPACGFEGPSAEYERARSCPSCDVPWL